MTKQLPPTQAHINVEKFIDGVLIASDGTLAYVLQVQPIDLSMLEPAQAAWIKEQFGRFVSSVRFPNAIQVVMGSGPQDLSAYLARLEEQAAQEARAAALASEPQEAHRRQRMADRLTSMRRFIEKSLELVRPIESRYFVVVFHNPLLVRGSNRLTPKAFEAGKQKLDQLLGQVTAGLGQAAMEHRLLNEQQVAEVIYWFYHQAGSPVADKQTPQLRLMPSLITLGPDAAAAPSGGNGRDGGAS